MQQWAPAGDAGDLVRVPALRPEPARRHRRERVDDFVRDRFWVIPLLLLVGGIVLALLTAEADRLPLPDRALHALRVGPDAAGTILGILATSMLTFVGVVFTITLVALQLASSQLSPRVLRTFTRSTLTKVTFGTFLATFSFSVVLLVLDESVANDAERSRAVTAAFVLVMLSVVVFVAYVTATMRLLQVSWVITAVADDTRAALRATHPPATTYREAAAPVRSPAPAVVRLPLGDDPRRWRFGVVQGLDRHRLVALARRHDCVLEVVPRQGEYVASGGELVRVHGEGPPPASEQVAACFHLGRARTLYQDPAFGLRQLVDVATQALSPALNQATTAVQVVDRLEELLLRVDRAPLPNGLFVDDADVVRLVQHATCWDELVDLAFVEIVVCGAGHPQVTRRLVAAFDALERDGSRALAACVERHRDQLRRAVESEADPAVRGLSLSPHRTGLG